MRFHADELDYYLIDLDNHLCLFTNMRIDRDTVPEDLHCYDVRDGDDCTGIFAQIQSHVLVNHWGTILTKDPIPLNEHHCYWPEQEDPDFGPCMTLDQFRQSSREELKQLYNEEVEQLAMLYQRAGDQSPLALRIQDAQLRTEPAGGQNTQNPLRGENTHG